MKSLRFLRKVSIRVRMCLFLATMLALECAVGFMHYNAVKSFDVPMMLLVLCVLVTLIGGLAVTASITAPINEFRAFMKKLKETLDFTLEYDVWSDDEMAEVGKVTYQFLDHVQELIGFISKSSAEVEGLSKTVLSMANKDDSVAGRLLDEITELSKMMERFASDMSSLNAGVQEVASGNQIAATRTMDIAKEIADASKSAEEGLAVIGQMSERINRAAEESLQSIATVNELAQKIEDINQLLENISRIATRTNMLALNAGIEAARAGAGGKGFAVVAEEIRKLAYESSDVASNVSRQMGDMSLKLQSVINSVRAGSSTSADANQRAKATMETISAILENLKKVSSAANDLSAVSEEQAASSEEISATLQSISTEVERIKGFVIEAEKAMSQLADSASDLSDRARNMEELALSLKNLVGRFKLWQGDKLQNV
ncbi:methyl-accepting chemotaxis protein [Acetomicrobium mobile DSM 13181]|uniref:Methyl-accepting chemotaxis protein n=1 Tax=Acetomicrobium mobile (strain ATCC BAA-54 / DSM 13181 / JCM 12221 / NGA) TaxID=891968 RepID=I4BWV3_ACEMN|nr:methyl-accepting chemotaxis protein [Acetomicrobium mobile]AFM21760.1 methyl-accepting chemotaxis protein [Acetomicrobium mobile DSM 13181]